VQKYKCKFLLVDLKIEPFRKIVFRACKHTILECLLMEYHFEYTYRTLLSIACHFARLILIEISLIIDLIKTQWILGTPCLQSNPYQTVVNLSILRQG